MLTIQASFLQVKDQFIYKEQGEQQIVMKMLVLLYNMRAQMVGINQIQNTYMQNFNHNANKDVWFKPTIFGCIPGLGSGPIG